MYRNLCDMLDKSSRRYWWRKAILAETGTIRYYKLRRRVEALASAFFNELKIVPGEKVAILLNNSELYPLTYFAALKMGAVVVPLNTFLKAEELRYIIKDSGAKVLITSSSFYPVVRKIRPDLFALRNVVLTDKESSSPDYIALRHLEKGSWRGVPWPEVVKDDVAVIIYTSGTTGHPKGAMLTHRNLLSDVESSISACSFGHRDRVLLVLPMFHSFTVTACILMPLACGAGIVIAGSLQQLKKVMKRILISGVTVVIGIPSLYMVLARVILPRWMRSLLKIRLCISGAAPLPETVLKEFENNWKIPLVEGYGLSEASPVVSLNPVAGTRKPGSVGLPLPGVEVKIAGPDEAELATNQVGEVIVKGNNVMKGYYNKPEETKQAIRGGWLFTGDMGKIDEDGYLFIVDRKKDMILVRGLNVYPREVEQVLQEHPDIEEVSVVGKPFPGKGEIPIAFIVPKDEARINISEITKFCRQRLADYKVPRQILVKDQMPRTPTGKILKRKLKKMAGEETPVSG